MIERWLADHPEYLPSAEQIAVNIWRLTHQATGQSHRLKITSDARRGWFLKQEAQWLERLNTDSSSGCYKLGKWQGGHFLVSEFVFGDPLTKRLRAGALNSEMQIQELIKQCVEGVLCLHQQQVVHADIKPNNLLYSDEQVVLIDFANAGWLDQPLAARKYHSYSPNFSHPDLIESKGSYKAVFDWFSLIRVAAVLVGIGIPEQKPDRDAQWVESILKAASFPAEVSSHFEAIIDELTG